MTERIKGFIVTLEEELADYNVQPILDAISMVKHVLNVKPITSGYDYNMCVDKAKRDLMLKIRDVLT